MSYRQVVDPGIDISHYGAPYKGMLGLGEMLYRYQGLGVEPWTGAPADDPRIVQQYTVVRSTYRVRNLGGDRTAARAADILLGKARSLFSGNTVRKIGTTGWTSDGRVGFEVILAANTRAGEIKSKNYRAGQQAATSIGGDVQYYDAQTSIPSNAFVDAPPTAPSTPETTPSTTPSQDVAPSPNGGFLTQTVGGLPVWAVGLIGVGLVGGVVVLATRKKSPAAVTANRRRRSRRVRRNSRHTRRRSRRPRRNPRRFRLWGWFGPKNKYYETKIDARTGEEAEQIWLDRLRAKGVEIGRRPTMGRDEI